MELTVKTKDLFPVLRLAYAIAEKNTTMPVLRTVLLRAENGHLWITCTDLEVGLTCPCPANIKTPGSAAIPIQRFLDYVKLLPDAELQLKAQASHWLSLCCGRAKSRIAGLAAESYPELPQPAGASIDVPQNAFLELAGRVLCAVSSDDTQFTLTGALLKFDRSAITMAATDGRRLSLATAPLHMADPPEPLQALIPKKALSALLRLSEARGGDPIRFRATDNHLFFKIGTRQLLSRRLSGSFPDYERVLPSSHESSVIINRNELRGVIERAARFADQKSRCVVVHASKARLVIRAAQSEVGESEESIPVPYDGREVKIGLNPDYLVDFLDSVQQRETVAFLFRDGNTAVELRPDAHATAHRYVVMPMAIPA